MPEVPFSGSRVFVKQMSAVTGFSCLIRIHPIPAKTTVKQIGSTRALMRSGHESGSALWSLKGRLLNKNPFMVVPKRPWIIIAGDIINKKTKLAYLNIKLALTYQLHDREWDRDQTYCLER